MRVLEFFAGMGGLSEAILQAHYGATVVGAFDIDQTAKQVYSENFNSPYRTVTLEAISADAIVEYQADTWWLSPPCLPFTAKGKQKDVFDQRNAAFMRLVELASELRPERMLIENVVGFEDSSMNQQLNASLLRLGYRHTMIVACPSEYGWPNRRRRVYKVVASTSDCFPLRWPTAKWEYNPTLFDLLDLSINRHNSEELYLTDQELQRYGRTIDIVDSTAKRTACFGAAYGKAITRAGSYIKMADGIRRFAPREVARLLGYRDEYFIPSELANRAAWRLLGNSLCIPIVRQLLNSLS